VSGLDDDLALALELADIADGISMGRYGAADLAVERKPDLTPVTEADRAVEQAIRLRLAEAREQDAVLGEEFPDTGTDPLGRRWIIDPIDGTMSYVRRMPTWATLIALEVEGQSMVGVVSMPALARRWWAVRGGGAFGGGSPLRVSSVADLSDAQLLWSGVESWDAAGRFEAFLALARKCWRTRGIGDAWQYMLVAEGAAELAMDPEVSPWDLAAVQVIIEEAGGRFSDFSGHPTAHGGSGLASNGLVHEAALSLIGQL
jgi:histidinol-phosphatase